MDTIKQKIKESVQNKNFELFEHFVVQLQNKYSFEQGWKIMDEIFYEVNSNLSEDYVNWIDDAMFKIFDYNMKNKIKNAAQEFGYRENIDFVFLSKGITFKDEKIMTDIYNKIMNDD
jgi:hypothetical protein